MWFSQFDQITLSHDFPFSLDGQLVQPYQVHHQSSTFIAPAACLTDQLTVFFKQSRINSLMQDQLQHFDLKSLRQFDSICKEIRLYVKNELLYAQFTQSSLLKQQEGFIYRRTVCALIRLISCHFYIASFYNIQHYPHIVLGHEEWLRLNHMFKEYYQKLVLLSQDEEVSDLCQIGLYISQSFVNFREKALLEQFKSQVQYLAGLIFPQNQKDVDRLERMINGLQDRKKVSSLLIKKVSSDEIKGILKDFAIHAIQQTSQPRTSNSYLETLKKNTIIRSDSLTPRLRPRSISKRLSKDITKQQETMKDTKNKNQIRFDNYLKAIQNQFGRNQFDPVGLGFALFKKEFQSEDASQLGELYDNALKSFDFDQEFSESSLVTRQFRRHGDTVSSIKTTPIEIVQEVSVQQENEGTAQVQEGNQSKCWQEIQITKDVHGVIEDLREEELKEGSKPLSVQQLKWLMQKGWWSIPILMLRNRIIQKKVYKILNR